MERAEPAGPQFNVSLVPKAENLRLTSIGRLFLQQVGITFAVVAVLIAAGAVLVFKVQGEAYTRFTAAGFVATCFFAFIIFLPANTLFACRTEVVRGHSAIRARQNSAAKRPLADPLRRTIPMGIVLATLCTAMVCAAYSIPQATPRRPAERSGLSAARCVPVRQRMCSPPQSMTASSRHIAPWCGICRSIQARSSCMARLALPCAIRRDTRGPPDPARRWPTAGAAAGCAPPGSRGAASPRPAPPAFAWARR